MANLANRVLKSRAVRSFAAALEEKIPGLRAWHRFEYEEHFAQNASGKARMFSGVYPTYRDALNAIPKNARIGYDNEETADRHASEVGHIWPSDYPVLFWLKSLLPGSESVFDIGGATGMMFHGFQKYLEYPPELQWTVCEAPAVAKLGSELAKQKHVEKLHFKTAVEDASGMDVLIASGSLQYLETPLWATLSMLAAKPKHLLINRVPLTAETGFFTLQNIGQSICTYQIWNRDGFVRGVGEAGYALVDSWDTPEFSCYIPFHPERAIKSFSGMYFRRKDVA